jgi:hypothetical protein
MRLCITYSIRQIKSFNKILIGNLTHLSSPKLVKKSIDNILIMTISRLPKRHYSRNFQCSCENLASSISLVSIAENAPMDDFTNRPFKGPSTLNGWGTVESRKSYKRGLHELTGDSMNKSSRRCDETTKQACCKSMVSTVDDTWGFYVEN